MTVGVPSLEGGKFENVQPPATQAIQMAVDEINEAGGPVGTKLNPVIRANATKPQQTRTVVQQFVNNDNAVAIAGGLSSSVISPLYDFLLEQKIPIITPYAGSTFLNNRGGDKGTPKDTSDDEWIWRTTNSDTLPAAGTAKKLMNEGVQRFALMHDTSQGSRSWANAVGRIYENLGGTIAKRLEIEKGKTTYGTELDRLFEADFGAWGLIAPTNDIITIVRNWADAGYGRQLVIDNGHKHPKIPENVGDIAKGTWIVAGAQSLAPNYDTFVEKFNQAGDEKLNSFCAPAYDSINVTALAAHRAGTADRTAIEKNLGPVTRQGGQKVTDFAAGKQALDDGNEVNYEGAATPCDFTDNGNVLSDLAVFEITENGFEQTGVIPHDDLRGATNL